MRPLLVLCVALVSACGPASRGDDDTGDDDTTSCSDGDSRCTGLTFETCQGGSFVASESCAEICDPTLGCQSSDPCNPLSLGQSYVGCDYYPTVTSNVVGSEFAFAVTASNAGNTMASVMVTGPAGFSQGPISVAPGAVEVIRLPWTAAKNQVSGMFIDDAYHLVSDQPVTVYQFNPLDYTLGNGDFSYTNDASLLLPSHRLGLDYLVASYGDSQGFAAITATQDSTTITVVASASVSATSGVPAFPAGVPTQVTLNAGDVLSIGAYSDFFDPVDLTGTRITSDKPIQVIGGHFCTFVPLDLAACDHLEESMFPVETLGTRYAVTMPAVPPLPGGKEEVIRIVAAENDTQLVFDPPVAGAATTLQAGQFVGIERHQGDFVVSANHKILVAQYMEGQEAGGDTGDPAQTLAVATDQYRTSYLFHAPLNYEVNYVNITAPVGTQVMIDGQAVSVTQPIGGSGLGIARYQLSAGQGGNHTAQAGVPFGISVYGYGQYTSYWYPGGLNLENILD